MDPSSPQSSISCHSDSQPFIEVCNSQPHIRVSESQQSIGMSGSQANSIGSLTSCEYSFSESDKLMPDTEEDSEYMERWMMMDDSEDGETFEDDCESQEEGDELFGKEKEWYGNVEDEFVDKKKVITSIENILKLFKKCFENSCGSKLVTKVLLKGGALVVDYECQVGHSGVWESSPFITGNNRRNRATEIDLLLGSYIEASSIGASEWYRMCNQLNIATCSRSYHYKAIADCTHRAVNDAYQESIRQAQQELLDDPNGGHVILGDMRFDSRRLGRYGSYSLICQATGKVIAYVVLDNEQTGNSCAKLEVAGLLKALNQIPEEVLEKIDVLGMDENLQGIAAFDGWNEERRRQGKHTIELQLCTWHRNKNNNNHVKAAGKQKGCAIILEWTKSISKHWYYICQKSSGSSELLREMYLSIPLHMQNIHEFKENRLYKRCDHGPITESKKYLKAGHPAVPVITRALRGYQDGKLRNLHRYTKNIATTEVEVFNRCQNVYLPKDIFYSHKGMVCGGQCAVLAWNTNSEPQAERDFRVYRCKYARTVRGRNVKRYKSHAWQKNILRQVIYSKKGMCDLGPVVDVMPVKRRVYAPEEVAAVKANYAKHMRFSRS